MSEIIEFDLPPKYDYSDDNYGDVSEDIGASSNSNSHCEFIILDTVDNIRSTSSTEYQNEDFLIINEEANDGELLIDNSELDEQFHECSGLQAAKEELFATDYVFTEQHLDGIDDLVEEDNELEDDLPPPSPLKKCLIKYQKKSDGVVNSLNTLICENDIPMSDLLHDEIKTSSKPSDKMLNEFKGPRRYLLFDDLIATIVDFDENTTPIVEFSMIASVEDEKLPVECGICPDVMPKSRLAKHQKNHLVHGTNRYACIYCSETYRDCKYLAGHARRHMGIRPYVCEICKLYFSTKQDLRVHNQRRHLKKEHVCDMCGKTFAQNTQLKRHREATHEKKRRFHCNYCQKAYYKNFSLKEHIRNVHMGERRMLSCPFCGMQCRDAHKMARHRKEMHLNQDSYVCDLCKEVFTDINYFDAHKRSIQCRSNTERHINKKLQETTKSEFDYDVKIHESQTSSSGMFNEEYEDEDGDLLLVEGNVENDEGGSTDIDDPEVQQFVEVMQFEQNVEHILPDGGCTNVSEIGDTNDQYANTIQRHYQTNQIDKQEQQQQQQSAHNTNDFELVYEITLETEDN